MNTIYCVEFKAGDSYHTTYVIVPNGSISPMGVAIDVATAGHDYPRITSCRIVNGVNSKVVVVARRAT